MYTCIRMAGGGPGGGVGGGGGSRRKYRVWKRRRVPLPRARRSLLNLCRGERVY